MERSRGVVCVSQELELVLADCGGFEFEQTHREDSVMVAQMVFLTMLVCS